MFCFGSKIIFLFTLALGKQTPTLTSRKIFNSPRKRNTPTQTLHGLGFGIARRFLLSFPHFSPKRMDSTPIDPPQSSLATTTYLGIDEKTYKIVYNFELSKENASIFIFI